MVRIKTLILFFYSINSNASWTWMNHYAGFFGNIATGFEYEIDSSHAIEFSIGRYQIDEKNFHQTNFAYRYSPYKIDWKQKLWTPLQAGIFSCQSWDKNHYFAESPGYYPYEEYYAETMVRTGIELGSGVFLFKPRVEIFYYWRILDLGLLAIYNNHDELENYKYFTSSGLSLNYRF